MYFSCTIFYPFMSTVFFITKTTKRTCLLWLFYHEFWICNWYFIPHCTIASKTGFRLYPVSVSVYSTLGGTWAYTVLINSPFSSMALKFAVNTFCEIFPSDFLIPQIVWFLPLNLLRLTHSSDCWLTWVLFQQGKQAILFSYGMIPSNSILLVTIALKSAYFTYRCYGFIINLQARKDKLVLSMRRFILWKLQLYAANRKSRNTYCKWWRYREDLR